MNSKQNLSDQSAITNTELGFLQPAPAWMAILSLVLLTVLGILVGGKILNFAFPLAALIVGLFLYFRYPIFYVSFTWWLWFITAFIRRLVDYRSSYTEPSSLLLAPYLVTAITLVTVFQYLPKAYRQGGLPFILPFVGVFYGFCIGLINNGSPFKVTREFLDWLTPLTFGFYLWVNWRKFPSYYQNIQQTFVWGTLVMGIYGISQYVIGFEWDINWLIDSGMNSANGYADKPIGPFAIRVFSTMPSVEPFGAFMAASLLLLFNCRNKLSSASSVVGYLAFLLSLMRSAWLGWFGGLLILCSSLKPKHQMRLIVTVIVMVVLVVVLAIASGFSEIINARLNTLTNVQEDGSAQVRQQTFAALFEYALINFVGDGIGQGWQDNAILAFLIHLGWIGTISYLSGLLMLVIRIFHNSKPSGSNIFMGTTRAIVISCLIRMPVNGTAIAGIGGLLLWSFLALAMASQKYELYQKNHQF